MKGTIVGTIIRLIRSFLRLDHFPGPQYGADRFRMGLFTVLMRVQGKSQADFTRPALTYAQPPYFL